MLQLATIAAANFGFIFLKAFQQRNVVHNNFKAVIATSTAMAAFEVYVIASIAVGATQGWRAAVPMVLALGLGGGLGCVAAMLLHNRLFMRDRK